MIRRAELSYNLIFENKDFIVIDKLPGIEFHGDDGILSILRDEYAELYGVHRLDKDTSGIMIFAKSKEVEINLKKQFESKSIRKIYLGILSSKPKKKMGKVLGDITKSRNGNYKLSPTKNNPSITKFISLPVNEFGIRGIIFSPRTGKTHQLRVVAKSLGSPLLGDKRYGGKESDRMYLHAWRISFHLNNKEFSFDSWPRVGEHFINLNQEEFKSQDIWDYFAKEAKN